MKKVLGIVLCVCLILALGSFRNVKADSGSEASGDEAADNTEWVHLDLKVATSFGAGNINEEIITRLQEKIDDRMDGAIQFTIYPNGTLVGYTQEWDGVVNHVSDVGFYQPNYNGAAYPLCLLLEYPVVSYTGTLSASHVFKEYCETLKPAELDDVHVLFYLATGGGAVSMNDPISSLEDIDGKQLWATAISAKECSAFGGTPVSLDFSELYESLRNGMINGSYTIIDAVANGNLYEVSPYLLVSPINNQVCTVIMNKEVYESMPEAQQQLLDELCDEVYEEFASTFMGNPNNDPAIAKCLETLKEVNYLEGEALDAALEELQPLTDEYVKSLNDMGFDGDGALALVKELADKYNAIYESDSTKNIYESFRP